MKASTILWSLMGIGIVGCVGAVGEPGTGESALFGEQSHFQCFVYQNGNSICIGDAVTFESKDLRFSWCDFDGVQYRCAKSPTTELLPGVSDGRLECPDGTEMICERGRTTEDYHCWCQSLAPGATAGTECTAFFEEGMAPPG